MTIEINKPVPDFSFNATNNISGKLSDYKNKTVILFFYPRDKTPGCTQESIDFSELYSQFSDKNCVIFGVSRDSLKSHESFKAKYNMPFELISDPDEELCQLFNVMVDKNMYGKKVRGIQRSTFIIDPNGVLIKEWRKVKVPEHAQITLNWITDTKLF